MGIFGWSLPPGCTHRMIDEAMGVDQPCECCGLWIDDCICEECSKCGEYGNPDCYSGHGMEYSAKQLEGQKKLADDIEADRMRADAMYEEYTGDREDRKVQAESIFTDNNGDKWDLE